MSSQWCLEEITVANQKQIGVMELVWPGMKLDIHNYLCEPILLVEDDFTSNSTDSHSQLKDDKIDLISHKIESIRVRNMAARQDSLVGEFIREAQIVGRSLVQEYKYLVERKDNDEVNVFIPAVGVPQSYDCYESLIFKDLLHNPKTEIFLIYDDLRIKKKWIEHLDWLNGSLEVKTIKKKEFATWLQSN